MRGMAIEEAGRNPFFLLVGSAGKNYWVAAFRDGNILIGPSRKKLSITVRFGQTFTSCWKWRSSKE